jgi:hypothetical protein
MFLDDFEQAASLAERAVSSTPVGIWGYAVHAAALGHLDRKSEMEEATSALLGKNPNFSCAHLTENLPLADEQYREIYLEGLRKAGVPEG